MKTTKIEVKYGRTINTGNYESLRLEYCQECVVQENESILDVFDHLRTALRDAVHDGIGKEMAHLHAGEKPQRRD